ncbi:MAG: ABC transporter permease, partial [Clostridiales bacterium]|nr:ABC transporter permease [Clostridiales bacterium]
IDTVAMNLAAYPLNPDKSRPGYLETAYDIIAGKYPENMHDLILVTDKYNKVEKAVLEQLGLEADRKSISFKDILGQELKVIPNDLYYKQEGELFVLNGDPKNPQELYESEEAISLKIVGIVRPARKTEIPALLAGVSYSDDLNQYFIKNAEESAVVQAQKKVDYNVLTGEPFAASGQTIPAGTGTTGITGTTQGGIHGGPLGIGSNGGPFGNQIGSYPQSSSSKKDTLLSMLGASATPFMINIYPMDFENKNLVLEYLDDWNEDKKPQDKIIYTDLAGTITELTGGIMRAITLVLIAFAATSLVVSIIMIGIITYISVLERTKEIGILRALGARKKDISRVFNAETFLIGAVSGILGILLGAVLTIPVNNNLYRLTTLKDVAQLDIGHALLLILISITLTLMGGFIPARMAAKKDPVKALRSQ